jgi:hypothetical protein
MRIAGAIGTLNFVSLICLTSTYILPEQQTVRLLSGRDDSSPMQAFLYPTGSWDESGV